MNPIWISCCLHLIWCGAPAVIELFGLFYLQKLANFFPISRFFSVPHFPQEISRSLISRFPSGNVHLYTWQSFKKGSHFSVGHFLSILSTLKKQHSWRLCRVDVFMDSVETVVSKQVNRNIVYLGLNEFQFSWHDICSRRWVFLKLINGISVRPIPINRPIIIGNPLIKSAAILAQKLLTFE